MVTIDRIETDTPEGPVIHVKGADMVDNTPIFDIKPYIPYADSIQDAKGGFTDSMEYKTLKVVWNLESDDSVVISEDLRVNIEKILSNDPRPHYQNDPERVYGMSYAGYNVKFKVKPVCFYFLYYNLLIKFIFYIKQPFIIGKHVFIGMKCYLDDLCYDKMEIGSHVIISYGVYFACHGRNQNHNKLIIKDGAYIGMRASIIARQDVVIGERAVVGAQTLVNKSIPDGKTAVGIPCRILEQS